MSRIIETITKEIAPDPWITDAGVENLCCAPTDMPPCKKKVEPWRGYTQEEILERLNIDVDDNNTDAAGNFVEVRLINDNPSGLCGEQVTKQIENAKACCDGVTAIVWDDTNSVEVIADNSNGYVYVTGGRPPYTWSVRGSGFWFNSVGTIRDAETDEPWIRIFALSSCGSCAVTATDGCSEITEDIRSAVGQWVELPGGTVVPTALRLVQTPGWETAVACYGAAEGTWCQFADGSSTFSGRGEGGRYRVDEAIYHKYYGTDGDNNGCSSALCSTATGIYYEHLNQVPGWPWTWCWQYADWIKYNCDYVRYRSVWEWQC